MLRLTLLAILAYILFTPSITLEFSSKAPIPKKKDITEEEILI